jgi:Regulator of chromosome condensation (RCC1) repeat
MAAKMSLMDLVNAARGEESERLCFPVTVLTFRCGRPLTYSARAGRVYTWGSNVHGQAGDGQKVNTVFVKSSCQP